MAGLVAIAPVNTPVFARLSWRSRSVLEAAACRYVATASAGLLAPPCQPSGTSAGQTGGSSASTSGCSGASTMKVAPNTVSGRVVNTSIGPADVGNRILAPSLRPIQLRCMVLIDSGHVRASRSSSSRSAYAVIRSIHCRMVRRNTGKLPMSLRPSAVTSSLANTVPSPGTS